MKLPFSRRACAGLLAVTAVAALGFVPPAAASGELNLYSSRHYDTDERLYKDFEDKTGIKINRIEDKASVLIERIKAEGANSPADVLLTVDAGRLWAADQGGIFQPIKSDTLEAAVPANMRHPDGHWFAFSQRARLIFYDKADVSEPPQTYEALADPKYKGKVCARSGSNIYQLSLMASIIEAAGADAAKGWAEGLVANFARDPEGGDTDQLRAIVSGQCDIVISNSYYFGRAIRKDVDGLSGSTDGIGIVFPNQGDRGTHVNISGGGVVANAPNKENAIKFLEYLVSAQAQQYFAEGNDEYPVVAGTPLASSLDRMKDFKIDPVSITVYGKNQAKAQEIYNEVGYK